MPISPVTGDPAYLIIAIGALFVHVCYQLSVSVLTHFSSHSISRRVSDKRLLLFGLSYGAGVILTTSLILTSLVSLAGLAHANSQTLVTIIAIFAPFVGLATMLWYYRQGPGTQLWLPRPLAKYLLKRSRKTRSLLEAFVLGGATVIGELPFLVGPLLFVTYLISQAPSTHWFIWAGLYSLVASLPLLVTTMYFTSGHSVARSQKWREKNKAFLQWTSGIMLLLLTLYLSALQLGVLL